MHESKPISYNVMHVLCRNKCFITSYKRLYIIIDYPKYVMVNACLSS